MIYAYPPTTILTQDDELKNISSEPELKSDRVLENDGKTKLPKINIEKKKSTI